MNAPHDTGDTLPCRPAMTPAKAEAVLTNAGLRDDMTEEEFRAVAEALPADMLHEVGIALRVSADAIADEVAALQAFVDHFGGSEANVC